MDIKERFKSFIDKQKLSMKSGNVSSLGNAESVSSEDFEGRTAVTAQRKQSLIDYQLLTPEAEQVVIDCIEPLYFESENVDVSEHELNKFPDSIDVHVISGIRSKLRKQHNVVSRKVSELIMQKQGLCSEEMAKIEELQKELLNALNYCNDGRSKLALGRSQFTSASLGILSNYSKRQKIASVIRSLRTVRTLQMTDVQLQSLLKAEDYPGAIQLLLECQKAAATFKHFTCISELSTKLQDTLEDTEEQLDAALNKLVANFNPVNYEKLQIAYGLLGKTQTLMDQLHMHLTSHIHNSAFTIVLGYVELYNSGLMSPNGVLSVSSFSKMQYADLCKYVNEESFLPCLLDLCKCMWNVLRSYRNILSWHEKDEKKTIENTDIEIEDLETQLRYTKHKLEHGLIRIWQDVQAKVRTFILASDLSHFKFDDFLHVLDVINKLIDVGEAFCGSKSETLHESIKKQSISYFRNHHRARMEELHMFLENEGWEVCPVKPSFTILQLMEYRFLKNRDTSIMRISTPTSSPIKRLAIDKRDYFDQFFSDTTPFDCDTDETLEEDIMANGEGEMSHISDDDSDEDVPEELKRDYVDEQTGDTPQTISRRKTDQRMAGPIVTNTTLTILRLIGKYIQMMRLLQPIAFDVMVCLSHLFDYYLFTVFNFFGARSDLEQNLSTRLRGCLKRIQDALILNTDVTDEDPGAHEKVPTPGLSPVVDCSASESVYGLGVRVAAVESLIFLATQLETLYPYIEPLIPHQRRTFCQQFYSSTVKIAPEIRHHVYMAVAAQVIDYDGILNRMSSVKWDISDLMSQHNQYVDVLLRQLQVLTMRLDEVSRCCPIPREANMTLWECIVRITNRTLLEGFSQARRCTNEGRSLMQLDFQQFLMKLECLTNVRPLPDRQLVETYIKAYYLPEAALEEWLQQNRLLYSQRQLQSLISTMTHVTKKTRSKLNSIIENGSAKS